jgi:hypothetical protein
MDCRKSWFLKVLERERERVKNKSASELVWVRSWYSEWVIEWVRWKTSIIIITSSIITRHRTAMIIRWAVQQPEESASDGEWERASEWLSEWDERHRSSSSRHQQHLYHHHQLELLTCHGTAMIIQWTVRSRDFYKCVLEREKDRVRAKIKRERVCLMEGDSATM